MNCAAAISPPDGDQLPPLNVPLLPLPDESAATVPAVSSNFHQPTRPVGPGGVELTVSVSVAELVPYALKAVMVTLEVPTATGVPLISPLELLTLRPEGKPVAP